MIENENTEIKNGMKLFKMSSKMTVNYSNDLLTTPPPTDKLLPVYKTVP